MPAGGLPIPSPASGRKRQRGAQTREERAERKSDRKRSKELEKELRSKEKALAEAAALIILRKKAQAIWGDREDD